MGKPVLGQFQKDVLLWVARMFDDPDMVRTGTYTLYQGEDDDGPVTTEFSMPAICVKDEIGSIEQEGTAIQQHTKEFFMRKADLPAGVALADLNVNDRYADKDGDYAITYFNKVLGFLFHIRCLGDQ